MFCSIFTENLRLNYGKVITAFLTKGERYRREFQSDFSRAGAYFYIKGPGHSKITILEFSARLGIKKIMPGEAPLPSRERPVFPGVYLLVLPLTPHSPLDPTPPLG
jgi:hypothetical protein